MASIKSNKWYQWYLREVSAGRLELPAYSPDENRKITIHYGEVFCRVPDCSRAQHAYTSTNNLRTHVKSHEIFEFPTTEEEKDKGGRVSQKLVDQALGFYKSLFAGKEPGKSATAKAVGGTVDLSSDAESTVGEGGRPILPVKKDGQVHVTNMRLKVRELGHNVPCQSCGERKNCCKNINLCDHFVLFDCGDLHPTPVDQSSVAAGNVQADPNTEEG
ncbi:hypothetical protein BDV59DRAFT_189998 [Aspergillus ambiguus]|uniref:uncharacterized protein n=1 Tax=Aspergillus ambiguus TaxID=176160 RepID=UPI003CCE2DF4